MPIRQRHYGGPQDFHLINEFLRRHYQPGNRDGNWFHAEWEYAYTHPCFDESAIGEIGLWEQDGELVAAATYESRLGEAFLHTHPDYAWLKPEMLDYAEAHLSAAGPDGRKGLRVYVYDFDRAFTDEVASRGYQPEPDQHRPLSQFDIPSPFPAISLPAGYRLKSLADDNDLHKVNRVLWRGFNNPGEPPEDDIEGRRRMQSGPHFRKDLTIVVEAPGGGFVSYCGMWYDATNRFAYVEPVATDPDYRRRGLGRAAVLEGIRRCGAEGATVAYVGSEQPFYLSFGFRKISTQNCWAKTL